MSETPNRFRLRPPRPADYARLCEWIPDGPAARRWAGPEMPWPLDGPELALALYREYAHPRALVDETGALVAFGEYYFKPPATVRFARLIVAPNRRGQRIIDTLIDRLAADAARHRTSDTLELAVFADNSPAKRANLRLGFIPRQDVLSDAILTMQRHP
ncbi:GNAT family N-acetyltransferase [Salinisphaera hydrothermalis]|uniref:GCN5-like N-acetyltransferase n=1 Tax=Salinisphaera hydrothermalis (strain C41B8) TaxID=1304275 RepID=A0A084IPF0_SALHC|nr:GNAT family N-acetyltransferase [Salinisphaera hydrothermalis]KEZ78584.1 GCN5-like N-acetyltransferase [Salinisphaera hydrothermalis C41B8]